MFAKGKASMLYYGVEERRGTTLMGPLLLDEFEDVDALNLRALLPFLPTLLPDESNTDRH